MANITEELNNPQWAEGIYQLETTDPVLGGPNGIANRQAKELAARTQYLKKKQEEYKPGAASTTKAGIVQLSSATDSDSEEQAATPKSVKAAYDKAVAAKEAADAGMIPSGAVMYFAGRNAPTGWLKANGAAVSRTTYAALFAAIGTTYGAGDGRSTFNLPDLRAEFLRGWDDGRGIDSGRAFGSAQSDAIRNIKGSLEALYGSQRYTLYTKAEGAFATDSDDGANTTFRSSTDDHAHRQKRVVFDASRSVPTADENRPRNIALLACIKI